MNSTSGPDPVASAKVEPIGGYFELDLRASSEELYPHALAFQSARAALLALLLRGQPRRIWMPWYLCTTMSDQAQAAGVEAVWYGLAQDLSPSADVHLQPGDWLLYVNYFGTCDANVDRVVARFPPMQVVIDNSHALYSPPRACLASIYSPRKFVGAPDGGYLVSALDVPLPAQEDEESARRCLPLLKRAAEGPEGAYAEYLSGQDTLSNQPPLRMSRLTHLLLRAVDYAAVAQRRLANFRLLQSLLGGHNGMTLSEQAGVPLAYPFLAPNTGLHEALIASRIYVPRYWPHLLDGKDVPAFERMLAQRCLPIPCDQRYGPEDMRRIAGLITSVLADSK
jgi:hypothetical protein